MPSASSSGAQPNSNSNSAKSREHNQGRQGRDYTPEQKSAVDKVRKCKPTAYYEILDIKVEASEAEIKKAYRKLALVMHPDKNGAPGADEAFKLISRAFQVLSDTDKRATFDRHGTDPDSRGTTDIPRGGSQFGFAPTPGGRFEGEISPEDLFNMFFGGMGPGGGIFGDNAGGFTTFGGPGIRVHQFGTPRRRRPAQAAAPGTQEEQTQTSMSRIFIQLLPLIIFFVLPILGSLFTGDSGTPRGPVFKLDRTPPFTMQRETPNFKIPFWVNPSEVKDLKKGEIAKLDKRAETHIINTLNYQCTKEQELQQNEANEAQGWFFVDQVRMDKARRMQLPSCQRLNDLGVRRRAY